jgi:hypothetical protein
MAPALADAALGYNTEVPSVVDVTEQVTTESTTNKDKTSTTKDKTKTNTTTKKTHKPKTNKEYSSTTSTKKTTTAVSAIDRIAQEPLQLDFVPDEEPPCCAIKGCKLNNSLVQFRTCAAHKWTCKKHNFSFCFGALFIGKHRMEALVNEEDNVTYCVCSKRCSNKVAIALRTNSYPSDNKKIRLPWEKDGKNGEDDSMRILLDWITEDGGAQYNKYCGKGNGISKIKIADRIAARINSFGVKNPRNGNQVMQKISHLADTFKSAYDWSNTETGAGLLESDQLDSFNDALVKKCPYYFELQDVMGERSSSQPVITSDYLDSNYDLDAIEEGDKDDTEELEGEVVEVDDEDEDYVPKQDLDSDDATITSSPTNTQLNTQQLQSQEISRHNIAMEHIANNTASVEAKKKELEILFSQSQRNWIMRRKAWN